MVSSGRKILSLGKGVKEYIDDAYKKFIEGGGKTGKNKKITIQKKDIDKLKNLQEKVKKAAENKEKVFSKKEYNKKLFDILKNIKKDKISKNTTKNTTKNKNKQSTDLTVTKQSSKKTGTNLVTIPKGTNIVKKKNTDMILKNVPATGKVAYLKKHFGKHWKKYAAGAGLLTAGFLIPKDKNKGKSSISSGDKKDKNKIPDYAGSRGIPKGKTKIIKKDTPKKTKSNDYTGRFIDKKGNVAYDSASDFFAHMFGTPKKRAMPKTTARIIGKGDKLKRKKADTKGAGKGVKFQAFKSGTKDKTIGKPMSPKDALNKKFKDKATMYKLIMGMTNKKPTRKRTMVEKIFGGGPDEAYRLKKGQIAQGAMRQAKKEMQKEYPKLMKRITKKSEGSKVGLKDLPPKSINPGIHKLPAKAKMNMGFKPMFGGGLIASFYDKPAKTEKYKGNTTSARQVKGYGKAKKKA